MKKIYRQRALNKLYLELASGDFDLRENALFQLALMLQRANGLEASSDAPDLYSDNLSRDLLRIRLSTEDQRQIVEHLSRLASTHANSRATAFWSLGAASRDIGLESLLTLLCLLGDQIQGEGAYEACNALRRWLESDELETEQLKLLSDLDPIPHLQRWLASGDRRLANCAKLVIKMLVSLAD